MSLTQAALHFFANVKTEIPEGTATGSISINPNLPFDLAQNERITLINNKIGLFKELIIDRDIAAGASTIYYEIREGLNTISWDTPITTDTYIILRTQDIAKQGRRKSQMFINFSSQAAASQYWTTFSPAGISNHSWNTVTTDNGTTVGTSELTDIITQVQTAGIVIPFDCTLVGFRATTYRVGNHQSAVGLFVGTPTYNDNATQDFTLRAYAAADNSAGPDSNYSQRPVKAEDLTRNFSLSAGDVILPAFNSVTNNGGNFRANYQIVLEYPLI